VTPGFNTGHFNWEKARTEVRGGCPGKTKIIGVPGRLPRPGNVPPGRDPEPVSRKRGTGAAGDYASAMHAAARTMPARRAASTCTRNSVPCGPRDVTAGSSGFRPADHRRDGWRSVPRLFLARLKLGGRSPESSCRKLSPVRQTTWRNIQYCVTEVLEKSRPPRPSNGPIRNDFFYDGPSWNGSNLAEQNTGPSFSPSRSEAELKDKYIASGGGRRFFSRRRLSGGGPDSAMDWAAFLFQGL